jgi:hypothetical protein
VSRRDWIGTATDTPRFAVQHQIPPPPGSDNEDCIAFGQTFLNKGRHGRRDGAVAVKQLHEVVSAHRNPQIRE